MAAASFEVEQVIPAEPGAVRDFLCDLHGYRELHPLIESISDLPPSEELPNARRYRVVDVIPLGPFKMRTSYVAALDPVSPGEVHGHAWQKPSVRLHTIYRLAAHDEGTLLREECRIEAPWLLRGFVAQQAAAAHRETLRSMAELFARRSDAPDAR